ncbi:peptidoglycan-binding domain-containing protein [Xanthomonas sacchari]|uniref:peptidoglycan-binding domain-containing protein n=1 Tax=Xanthomonas sacchari TaxID=56458 RepID=UPI0020C521C0|nr:peptidoglycan-binding protein [Xanthomonas sacchari]
MQTIAGYARTWEASVPALVERVQRQDVTPVQAPVASNAPASVGKGDANQTVFEAQQYLAALGMTDGKGKAISPDGDSGAGTEHAVKQYERSKGVTEPTGRVDTTMLAQLRADTLQAQPQFKRQTMTDLYGPLKDGELRRGEKGEPVYELRRQLQGLGYIQNAPPNWNGDRLYDEHMEAGVLAFQQANDLQETGRADAETRRQLNVAAVNQHLPPTTEFDRPENWPPQPPPYTRPEYQTRQQAPAQPTQPVPATQAPSPDRRQGQAPTSTAPGVIHSSLYRDCSNGVDALDRQLGRASDTASACMKASLTELAARNGLTRVDHVLLSERGRQAEPGQYVFVVEGDPRNPASLRAHMPTDQAIKTPMDVSFGALAQSEQQRQANLQAEVAREQPREAQTREANSRSMG